jgi:hypothetical protein
VPFGVSEIPPEKGMHGGHVLACITKIKGTGFIPQVIFNFIVNNKGSV